MQAQNEGSEYAREDISVEVRGDGNVKVVGLPEHLVDHRVDELLLELDVLPLVTTLDVGGSDGLSEETVREREDVGLVDDGDQGLGRVVRRLGIERSLERSEAGDLVGHSTDLGRGVGRDLSLGDHVLASDVLGGVLLLSLDVLKVRKSKRRSVSSCATLLATTGRKYEALGVLSNDDHVDRLAGSAEDLGKRASRRAPSEKSEQSETGIERKQRTDLTGRMLAYRSRCFRRATIGDE